MGLFSLAAPRCRGVLSSALRKDEGCSFVLDPDTNTNNIPTPKIHILRRRSFHLCHSLGRLLSSFIPCLDHSLLRLLGTRGRSLRSLPTPFVLPRSKNGIISQHSFPGNTASETQGKGINHASSTVLRINNSHSRC